jgi:hypothetical protein
MITDRFKSHINFVGCFPHSHRGMLSRRRCEWRMLQERIWVDVGEKPKNIPEIDNSSHRSLNSSHSTEIDMH